ncbi:MAG: GNAT family N-acetyltransferase [Chloroflexia bacterium]|nr:GNAT family N-acetyltransferase [Chloroflexia bacterium]
MAGRTRAPCCDAPRWRRAKGTNRIYTLMSVARKYRRHGVARALVEAARRFVDSEGGNAAIYQHTDTPVAGAMEFLNVNY